METSQLEETPVPVPFNVSWESSSLTKLAIQRLGLDKQIDRLPQQANAVSGTGTIFGVRYIEGVPCSVQCPKLDASSCSAISEAMQLSSQTGFGITCSSTAKSCKQDIAHACAHNAADCVRACMNAAGAQGNQQLCQQTCTQACSSTSPAPADLCLLISGNGTIGSMCKSMCNNCPPKSPDTSCVPDESDAVDPAALLSMAVKLYRDGLASTPRHVTYGAVLIPKPTEYSGVTTSLLINTTARHAVPVYVNLGNDALKKAASGIVSSITTVSHPFPVSRFFQAVITNALALASTFFIMIAFAFIPASVVAFVVKEREASHNSKHQQMISGASIPAFWLANYTWDVCVYALPCGLSLLAVHVFNIGAFTGTAQAFTVVVLLFVGYGLAIMPFTYMLSFLWKSHTQAQIWCLLLNLLSGLILMIASFVMGLIETTQDTNKALIWLYRLFPGFCLGNGLFNVATNSLIETLVGHSGITMHIDLYDWDICGKDILYLYVTAPLYFLIVVIIDSILQYPVIATKLSSDPTVADDHFVQDVDVITEERRLNTDTDDVVRLRRLRKVYPSSTGPKVAVRGLSFGMPRGECFGFLGINGAGKTSTLNMLTGAVLPSSGDAWLGGKHILTQQKAVRRLIGYCPQHDALLDLLTVREHLMLFGRLKGVSSARLPQMVKQLMEMLQLSAHEHKISSTLSGGNKRKLSVGIALIGSPPLIFLDEPSTGVDPAARRFMWSVISNLSTMSKSCSVVLTTHVMEEAEALCGRIGIMVGGRLRCLGSGQHLKGRYGTGYQLEFKLRGPTVQEIEAIHRKHFKVGTAGLHVPAPQVEAVCDALGDVARYREIREDGHGHVTTLELHVLPPSLCASLYVYALYTFLLEQVVYHALQQDTNGCPAHIFMEWWLITDTADRAISFIDEKFAGSVLLERHELNMRYRLSSETPLSSVFRVLEADKEKISMEEYGVCQTSLEQIFNSFAAMQEEETGAVRGVVQLPQSQPGSLQKA